MMRVLDVYIHDTLAGFLEQTTDGELEFIYNLDYLDNATYGISLSLPLQEQKFTGPKVKAFFSGLLPEQTVLHRLAKYLGVSAKNPFALLKVVGGECAGALALYNHNEQPTFMPHDFEILDDSQLKQVLELIKRRPMLAGDNGYRLSLAGAQNKLAVGFYDGKVSLIKQGAPTTHILKPIIDMITDSAHNELFCMKLAAMLGIEVPDVSLHFVENQPYYLIKRYDRIINQDGTIARLHQEDFCQALGINPEIKYEREGGPSITKCQQIITKYSAMPAKDQLKLLNIILFNYLIGNADAHGKNFSLIYHSSKPQLAPAYDLLSTTVYPELSEKMAMKIGGKYKPKDVYLRHFHKLVPETKAAQTALNHQIHNIVNKIIAAPPILKDELLADNLKSKVFDKIIDVIKQRSERLHSFLN